MNIVETAVNERTAIGSDIEAGGFAETELTVTCTPAAVDLVGIGFAGAGLGYLAAKAYYHYHGHFENGGDDARFTPGAGASADELIRARGEGSAS